MDEIKTLITVLQDYHNRIEALTDELYSEKFMSSVWRDRYDALDKELKRMKEDA